MQISISVFNLCTALFSILCSSGSAGEKHTHDVLFPPCTIHCVVSYGKNCGRLGEDSGEEKIYALMSNSLARKRCLLCKSVSLQGISNSSET